MRKKVDNLYDMDLTEQLIEQLNNINSLLDRVMPNGALNESEYALGEATKLLDAKAKLLDGLARIKAEVINQARLMKIEQALGQAWHETMEEAEDDAGRQAVMTIQRKFRAKLGDSFVDVVPKAGE